MSRATASMLAAWPSDWALALGDAALRRASSDAILERGRAYARSGCVEVLREEGLPEPALRALVTGTEVYTTELWIEAGALAGDCDCPHAQDGWFCKHQVAVALVWREHLAHAPAAHADPAPRAAARRLTAKDRREALRDFLRGLDPAVLADRLLDLAERDRDIRRELHQWRQLSETAGKSVDVGPLIDEVLSSGRDFIAWDETAAYVRRAEAVLPLLRDARERGPAAAIPLCVRALRRIWAVLESADDSNGQIGDLCAAVGAEFSQAVRADAPQPADFAETWLQLRLDEPFDCIDAAAVEAAMGDAALERYRALLAGLWRQAKDEMLALRAERAGARARPGHARLQSRIDRCERRLLALEPLHLAQLERRGASDEMLAVLREDLSDAHAHARVVAFLDAAGRFDEALAQARAGCAAFPDDWRLQETLIRCCERAGLLGEVLALLRAFFEARPGVEAYHRVLRAGRAAGADEGRLRAALLDFLQRAEQAPDAARSAPTRFGTRARREPLLPDVSLRAEILGSEGRWLEACRLVQTASCCRDAVLHAIAIHLDVAHHGEAVDLLMRVFEATIDRSASPHRQALALVGDIGQRMEPARRQAWLDDLRVRYRLKRNFVRDLPRR